MRDFYVKSVDLPQAFKSEILPYITERRRDDYFCGYDGQKLHYAVFTPENPIKTVVVSHGYTESTEKYHELVYYFLKSGFRVYISDHRGHGLSYREVEDRTLAHINNFKEYVDDFEIFTDLVLKNTSGKPYLFAHSMGCAIAALYMERHPETYEKAFLSSPMIMPASGAYPVFVAKAVLKLACVFGKSKKRAFISPPYTGKEEFENSCKTCRERFDEYEIIKENTPEYQTSCTTYGWAYNSMCVKNLIMKGKPEKIKTPVFIAIAGADSMVSLKPQLEFAAKLQNVETKTYNKAKHEIFGSEDKTAFEYFNDLFAFFAD